jgi:hypothetical protein
MRVHPKLACVLSLLVLTHCAAASLENAQSSCEIGGSCAREGVLTIHRGVPASVGVLESGGSCLALALPEKSYAQYARWNGATIRATGRIFSQAAAQNVTSYKLEDRWVAAGVCETGRILYVDRLVRLSAPR